MHFGHFTYRPSSRLSRQSGYMLLALIFVLAGLVIAMLVTAPAIATAIHRDKEEEMVHRGVEYARAIKKYYKKFGRYPANIEALEDTNHMRFLRKRYKDPFSPEGNWQLVRFGQVQFKATQRQGGGSAPVSGQPGLPNITGVTGMLQGAPAGQFSNNSGGSFSQSTVGGTFGQSNSGQANPGTLGTPAGNLSQQTPGGGNQVGGTFGMSTTGGGNQPMGGGGIIGVASTSDRESLRIVDDKNHYKDWKFVYDPTLDIIPGLLITGPYDPNKLVGKYASAAGGLGKQIGQQIGQPIGNSSGSTFNSGSSFGNSGSSLGQPQHPPDINSNQNPQ